MSWFRSSSDYAAVRAALALVLKAAAQRREPQGVDPDYLAWCGHLFYLRSALDAQLLGFQELTAEEFEGLRLMDEVARELGQTLRRCPHCGAFTEREITCDVCGKSMQSQKEGVV